MGTQRKNKKIRITANSALNPDFNAHLLAHFILPLSSSGISGSSVNGVLFIVISIALNAGNLKRWVNKLKAALHRISLSKFKPNLRMKFSLSVTSLVTKHATLMYLPFLSKIPTESSSFQ